MSLPESAMSNAETLSISIARGAQAIYHFVADPQNLPRWAPGLCESVECNGSDLIVHTPIGPARFRFAPVNTLGVLDHYVDLPDGRQVHVPLRVLANGEGSEVLFTLFRQPRISDEDYARDRAAVLHDLRALKILMETQA